MDRYYAESLGGHGWPKCHFVIDRATEPHTVVNSYGWTKTAKKAAALAAMLNAQTSPDWLAEAEAARADQADSLTRLRDWASRTKAFTERPFDPNAEPALVAA